MLRERSVDVQRERIDVAPPVATSTAAIRLIEEVTPDVALVDISLRVVVMSGYDTVPLAHGKAAAILEKPVSEALLLASLRPITAAGDICLK